MTEPTEVPTPWKIRRGDDFSEPFRFWLDENKSVVDPIVADGAEYTCQIRKQPKSADALATLTCSTSEINTLAVSLGHVLTADLPVGVWAWDIQEERDGVITTPLYGTVEVDYDVTR